MHICSILDELNAGGNGMKAEERGAKFGGTEALTLQEGYDRIREFPPPQKAPWSAALCCCGAAQEASAQTAASTPSQPLLHSSPPSPPHAHRWAFAQFGDAVIHVAGCLFPFSGAMAATPRLRVRPSVRPSVRPAASALRLARSRFQSRGGQQVPGERASTAALLPPCGSR